MKNNGNGSSSAARSKAKSVPYPPHSEISWTLKDEIVTGRQRHPFDMEDRTAEFGEAIVRFCKFVPNSAANNRLIEV
jgi:hypothetical protein